MYKIDWTKYLSDIRLRSSEKRPGSNFDKRNAFESDFGRVTFSSVMRRMHDKTQVIPLTSGDSVHTRLTHSIEVMNIAHSLGINYCRCQEFIDLYGDDACNLENQICAILRTAAFIHDIGNPPFGHFGEIVIQQYFEKLFSNNAPDIRKFEVSEEQKLDFTQFDGNAQGFRNVTKLSYTGDLFGLNLTCATLGAYLKYPNAKSRQKGAYIGLKKHGVYTSEVTALNRIAENCHLIDEVTGKIKRHPLSFLVEAADSICYLVMDIEDALQLKWISLNHLIGRMQEFYQGIKAPQISSYISSIAASSELNSNDKNIKVRVALIDYFVNLAIDNFKSNLCAINVGDYNEELIEDDQFQLAKFLIEYTKQHILCKQEVESIELTGHSVISGLLDIMINHAFHGNQAYRSRLKSILSKSAIKVAFHECSDNPKDYHKQDSISISKAELESLPDYAKLRLIVDFTSNMTDKYAVKLYQQLSGQRL
jgi:dGTPase